MYILEASILEEVGIYDEKRGGRSDLKCHKASEQCDSSALKYD